MQQSPVIFAESMHSGLFSKSKKIFVLTDENTVRYCLPEIEKQGEVHTIVIPAGEQHKNIETLTKVWQALAAGFADRNSVLVNIGGGVVCDIGGFAAATYMRGISFVQVPTTLLAMADAAHGGKTGIDFLDFKNMLGAFALPESVIVYPAFLKTLPQRELLSGFAEVIKHYIIADASSFHEVWKCKAVIIEEANWKPLLQKAIAIKQSVVARDPYEKGIRKILNFGHTVGHAIETLFLQEKNYLLHGEAVAIGMLMETLMAQELKIIQQAEAERIVEVLIEIFHNRPAIANPAQVLQAMKHDKKNRDAVPLFALPNRIGNCLFNCEVEEAVILNAFKNYNELYAVA